MAKWRISEGAHVDTCVPGHGNVVADFEEGDLETVPGSAEGAALAELLALHPDLIELVEADPEPDPDSDGAATGTVDEVLASVGADPAAAAVALEAEQARAKPRKTLVDALTAIVNGG